MFHICTYFVLCTLLFVLLHIKCVVVKIKVCSSNSKKALRHGLFHFKKGSPAWTFSKINLTTAQITPDFCTSSQLHNLYMIIAHFTTAQITSNNCTFLADNCTICVLLHAIANPGLQNTDMTSHSRTDNPCN